MAPSSSPISSAINEATAPAPISTATRKRNEEEYVPLCRAIQMGDWEKAQEIFNEDKDALTDILNIRGHRTLHVAIGNPENTLFLDNLLERIDPDSLPTLVNHKQQNGLHYAAILDNTIAAKKLVDKKPHLLFTVDYHNLLPIQLAIYNSHRTTFLYLLQMCKQYIGLSQKEGYHNPFEGEKGVSLLCYTILSGFLDVAYELLNDYPKLASTKVPDVPTKNYDLEDRYNIQDIENQETYKDNLVARCMKSYIYPGL
ncbi:hypothetical protein M8C21_011639 [Ambrosia artemisiifolia]|uniref:Uncharacterized protein n=1 Tax=Ambrosia artemisiifolia TaxID=4212 RepID=A0AAD5GV21_AMBAR|nr:hypothetical protein M8C21_011639 [Ambrosia artemisiifolia]